MTWNNPLQPAPATATAATTGDTGAATSGTTEDTKNDSAHPSTSTTSALTGPAAHYAPLQAPAVVQGIDPALAHLDPSLLAGTSPFTGSASTSGLPSSFTAKFNARTGQFAHPDAREPEHLFEYERAKRMSEFYFDIGAWEAELAKRGGVDG